MDGWMESCFLIFPVVEIQAYCEVEGH